MLQAPFADVFPVSNPGKLLDRAGFNSAIGRANRYLELGSTDLDRDKSLLHNDFPYKLLNSSLHILCVIGFIEIKGCKTPALMLTSEDRFL